MTPHDQAKDMILAARKERRTISLADVGNATGLRDDEIRRIVNLLPKDEPTIPAVVATWLDTHSKSDSKRVARAARKAALAVETLAAEIQADAGKAHLRAELKAAEQKVKALKAKLAGAKPKSVADNVVQLVACDLCGKQVKPGNGILMHKRRAHGTAS